MIIDCISDMHGFYPKLEGGDLLLVGGDWTKSHTEREAFAFFYWLENQKYRGKILIAGNHDTIACEGGFWQLIKSYSFKYLCDSGTEFEGLKIWGSPWVMSFEGMNPKCKAFTLDTEEELAEKFNLIPRDTDILITHSPPFGILDKQEDKKDSLGSRSLEVVTVLNTHRLHSFGHIHEGYGRLDHAMVSRDGFHKTTSVNCSLVNERYEPVNKPIRVIL